MRSLRRKIDRSGDNTIRIFSYARAVGDGTPLLNLDGTVNFANMAAQARFDTVIQNTQPVVHRPDIVQQLRNANPHIELIGYIVCNWWNNPNPALGPKEEDLPWAIYQAVLNHNGIVWGLNGLPIDQTYGQLWNFTSIPALDAIADAITQFVIIPNLWDSLFFDVACRHAFNATASGWDIVRTTGDSSMTDNQFNTLWENGHRYFFSKIKTLLGQYGKRMYGNCGPEAELDLFSGWMITEHFPTEHGWTGSMIGFNNGGVYVPGYLVAKYVTPNSQILVSNPLGSVAATEPTARLGICSALLGDGVFAVGSLGTDVQTWWFQCYDDAKKLKKPLAPAFLTAQNIWHRDFVGGWIEVNPATLDANIQLTP